MGEYMPCFHFWKSEIFLIIINFVLDTTFRKSEVFARRAILSHPDREIPLGAEATQRSGQSPTSS
jgi:hypothetical protein